MGPRDETNKDKIVEKDHGSETDDEAEPLIEVLPHISILPDVSEHDSLVRDHPVKVVIETPHHVTRKARKGWMRTLSVILFCIGFCVALRVRSFSNQSAGSESATTLGTYFTVVANAAPTGRQVLVGDDDDTLPNKKTGQSKKEKKQMKSKNRYKTTSSKNNKSFQERGSKRNKLPSSWDVDGPPVPLPEGVTLKSRAEAKQAATGSRRGPGGGSYQQLQQQRQAGHTPDDLAVATKTVGTTPVHASEALQCRESVINFVINATDGKDECDGLIKAFDKTCSEDDNKGPSGRRRLMNHRRKRKASRRIWDKLNVPLGVRVRVLLYRTFRAIEESGRYVSFLLGMDYGRELFFAEDEVYMSWSDAKYLVDNGLEEVAQCDARRFMHEGQESLIKREARRKLQSGLEDRTDELLQPLPPIAEKPKSSTTTASLQLPIKSQQHVSDKFVNDALMIQQGEKIIKAVNESAVAKEEAAKSKQSITDTADVVSAFLNDPKSVEARTCCASILNVFHELCSSDDEEQVSDTRLFFLVFVMACCGMIKSLIRYFRILWLPEAAGCILVGVLSGYVIDYFPHHDVSFDGNWFLRIMVPPIIFEAALSIDKRSFNRHIIPILIFAVAGTLVATFLTAVIVHYGTTALAGWCAPIPYVEALTFGALISSIDPIAVLSVLSNMGMNDTDTIYVLIFGESLLNDGVAIVLFHTLVHFLDETLVIDQDAIIAAAVHFFVVAFGSLLVGVASGMLSTVFFWIFHGCQSPSVEVLMFLCWALLPYYVCDGIGWSGIVAAVAVGFYMDIHIVGQHRVVDDSNTQMDMSENTATSFESNDEFRKRSRRRIFDSQGLLSPEARAHVGFVTELIATGMETAIFAYLGFFLFSHRYHWNFFHVMIALLACCVSRAVMIPSLSMVANWFTRIQQSRAACRNQHLLSSPNKKVNATAGVIVDKKMQIALWFAGLRGAMSFALVEHIPLYDSFSGEGTRLKPELKAMTSAAIMFTVFILGGYTYYMMQNLGIAPTNVRSSHNHEMMLLMAKGNEIESDDEEVDETPLESFDTTTSSTPSKHTPFRRQRHSQVDSLIAI